MWHLCLSSLDRTTLWDLPVLGTGYASTEHPFSRDSRSLFHAQKLQSINTTGTPHLPLSPNHRHQRHRRIPPLREVLSEDVEVLLHESRSLFRCLRLARSQQHRWHGRRHLIAEFPRRRDLLFSVRLGVVVLGDGLEPDILEVALDEVGEPAADIV